ncbi:MAG: hypothetical protein VR64_00035 [Desulfatitalea sp. BRH_c12]|jgi:hypothetical protein|nr:MAG: hypothetical protein VR64_00035 [Desulfatitalea sp. BRH_c12]
MGTILHVLRSEPDDVTAQLIEAISAHEAATVICLYPDRITGRTIDWDRLVHDMLSHDRVIFWW